ncbi:MAG: hypothetical protein ABWK53_00850 [Anaerolineales bacterium]
MTVSRRSMRVASILSLLILTACAGGPLNLEPAAGQLATASPLPVSAPTPTPFPVTAPAILETRRLTVEWPPIIRAGDADVIRLTLEVNQGGRVTPTAEYAGHQVGGETVVIPDVFSTHTVLAEARLDLAGVQISPAGVTTEALLPGRSVTFYWSVRPPEAGRYRGTLWFFLRFVPLGGGMEESRLALAALPIEIQVKSLLGLPGWAARWVGAVGTFVGGVLGFPFFEDILRWCFRGRRPKRSKK